MLAVSASPALSGALEEILNRQKEAKTVRARFVQERHAQLLDKPIRSEGVFYYAAGRGVRWQYEDGMLVVYDGEALYVFDPGTMQVEKIKDASEALGPLNFDMALLRKSYDIRAEETAGGIVATVSPRKEMPFEKMELRYARSSPFPEKVIMSEPTGDKTVIRFEDIRINEPVPEDLLKFTPPPGARVTVREE
ncbi:MAG: hypothetical protein Kow0025_19620 [Thermodesulfovibrionales bacterium]